MDANLYSDIIESRYKQLLRETLQEVRRLYKNDPWFKEPEDHSIFSQLRKYTIRKVDQMLSSLEEEKSPWLGAKIKRLLKPHLNFLEDKRTSESPFPWRMSSDMFYVKLSDILEEVRTLPRELCEFAEFLSDRCFEYLVDEIYKRTEMTDDNLQNLEIIFRRLPVLYKGSVVDVFQTFEDRLNELENIYSLFDVKLPEPKRLIIDDDIKTEIKNVLKTNGWMDYKQIIKKCIPFSDFGLHRNTIQRIIANMPEVIVIYDHDQRRNLYRLPLEKEIELLRECDRIYLSSQDVDPEVIELWKQSEFVEEFNGMLVLTDNAIDYMKRNKLTSYEIVLRSEMEDKKDPLKRIPYHFIKALQFLQGIRDIHPISVLDRMRLVEQELEDVYMCVSFLERNYGVDTDKLKTRMETTVEEIERRTDIDYLRNINEGNPYSKEEIYNLPQRVKDDIKEYVHEFRDIRDVIVTTPFEE